MNAFLMPDCPFCIIAEDKLCQKDKTAQVKSNGDGIFMKVKEQDSWGDWFDLEYHQSLRFLAITNEQQTASLTYSSSSSSHQQSYTPEHDDAVGPTTTKNAVETGDISTTISHAASAGFSLLRDRREGILPLNQISTLIIFLQSHPHTRRWFMQSMQYQTLLLQTNQATLTSHHCNLAYATYIHYLLPHAFTTLSPLFMASIHPTFATTFWKEKFAKLNAPRAASSLGHTMLANLCQPPTWISTTSIYWSRGRTVTKTLTVTIHSYLLW